APRWYTHAADPAASPVDSNLVLSLIAPRPLLLITSSEDAWSDPYGEYLAARAASPVWELLGKKGLGVGPYPAIDTAVGGDLAFMTHAGPHGPAAVDTKVILDFLDAHMK
ncbi:MAG: acetylxylan esterase, partial [Alphaproteobacteria bacterium]